MATASPALGELLPNDSEVFRALTNRNNLARDKTLRETAYLRRAKDLDGLSVGLTAGDAIRHLSHNFGMAALYVGGAHVLTRGLEVRRDPTEEGHALIHGLPFVEQDRTLAETIAWELVSVSRVVSSEPYSEPR
jgi:hypothetical protein